MIRATTNETSEHVSRTTPILCLSVKYKSPAEVFTLLECFAKLVGG
jgi:hypothetical protein